MKPHSFTSDRWKLIDQILDELLDSPPSRIETILANRCGEDLALRAEVMKLFAASEKSSGFLEGSALESESETFDLETTEGLIGGRVGKYQLLRLIGRGGMGNVFLAARADDEFHKNVAVKLVNTFWADDEMAQRFRRERQILAKLEHPNIARLIDGGTTKDKVAYLVMEYVSGVPVTEHCKNRCKSPNQILKVFLKVCEAVKYAHQNLIIHRDLKPNNILVTADGTVKLLDFGVAKLLQPELPEVSQQLTIGANILTPNYASPEQLKGETTTTTSDVYSLGVLLYELLSGSRPYDLKDKSLPEILRVISEEVPPKPSTTKSEAPAVAGGLNYPPTHAGGSLKSLKGDLDNICMKALAKDPADRYQTVDELTADINRHLETLPILARPPSAWYRINKYVNRHRLGVGAASLILILVVGWLASAVWQRNIARTEAALNLRRAYAADMILGMQAYEAANLPRLNDLLSRYQNTQFSRTWEYRFLENLAKPKAQLLLIPHSNDVWDVAFSPDSKTLATACADGFARIYSVPHGKLLATTASKEANIWRVVFSPDGALLASASGDANSTSVKVWNAGTGAETFSLVGHTARVRAVDFSPDGKLIATGSRDGTIRIWSAMDGRELNRFAVENAGVREETHDLHFTPDGSKLIATSGVSRVWEVPSGKVLRRFEETFRTVSAVSPNGKRFALGGLDGKIQIFDSGSVKKVMEIASHEARINTLTFSPEDSMIASASSDRTVRFFDTQSGEELQGLKTHLADAWSIAFSRDEQFIATSGTDLNVFLFAAFELRKASSFAFPVSAGVSWSAISSDRNKAALPSKPKAGLYPQTLWDVKAKRQIIEFSSEEVHAGAFSPDGAILATVNAAGILALWNSVTGSEIRRFAINQTITKGLVFSPDGKHLVSAGSDRTVRIWDSNNGSLVREVCRLNDTVTALGLSTDGRMIFVASLDATAKLFDFETGRLVAETTRLAKPITAVAFAPDSLTFATGDSAGEIQIRRTADAKTIAILTGSAGRVTALTYSPDGTRLVSASGDAVMRFWDTNRFDQVLAIRTGAPYMNFLAFTPDGYMLFSHGSVGRIRLWEATPR
jgi:WD40 repeat protein/serine/threonine protein kinase